MGDDITIQLGDTIVLSPQTDAVNPIVVWQPPAGVECPDCLVTRLFPQSDMEYTLYLTDSLGCSTYDALRVFVRDGSAVFIPNAFSPNGDGKNDYFEVFLGSDVESELHPYLRPLGRTCVGV